MKKKKFNIVTKRKSGKGNETNLFDVSKIQYYEQYGSN